MPGTVSNGSQLLLLLRDSASSWEGLCARLNIDLSSPADVSNRIVLSDVLGRLREAGLIEYDGEKPEGSREIKLTNQWNLTQTALGRPKLADIADIADYAKGMVVKPIFGRPEGGGAKPAQVFVLMPFNAELEPLYRELRKLGERLGVTIRRADETYSFGPFINKVWNAINAADLIIADCTQRNPNVFYEIGLAHAVGKRVVFITRSDDDIPSDIRNQEFIAYRFDGEGVDSLLEKLAGIINETLGPNR